MTATLYDHVDATFSAKTFVTVYKVDVNLRKQPTLYADAFGLKTLSLTDIASDALGNIYITDVNQGVFRFVYDGEKPVVSGSYTLSKSLQVSAIVTDDQRLIVYVATSTFVQELDWTGQTPVKLSTYEVPEKVKNIRDLQVSTKTIMVEADDNYYFYRLGETSVSNTLFIVSNQGTVCHLNQSSPQSIVVGLNNSLSYVITDGFVRVNTPTQNQTITVDAVSASGTANKTCTVEIQLSSLDPDTVGNVITVK